MKIKTMVYPVLLLVLAAMIAVPTVGRAEDGALPTLADWFGIEDDQGLIQKLDVPAVSDQGVEMKLNEILIEGSRVYLGLTMISDRIVASHSLQIGEMKDGLRIGDETFTLQEGTFSALTDVYSDGAYDGKASIVLFADVSSELLAADEISMTLTIDKIHYSSDSGFPEELNGEWAFDFLADGTIAKELTRRAALDHEFVGNRKPYTATEMIVSPIQTRIGIRRNVPGEYEFKNVDVTSGHLIYYEEGDLLGFIIEDTHGNRIEASEPDNNRRKTDPDVIEFDFFTKPGHSGWEWLKDAKVVKVTPYVATLAGPENDAEGIARYHALESFRVKMNPSENELEKFMADFEPDYQIEDVIDTANPYVKPVRMMQTTESGIAILLDKVMITEDRLYVSVLLGLDQEGDHPTKPASFKINGAGIEIGPIVPYPEDYFEVQHGGGGGGGPYIHVLHDAPLVALSGVGSPLLFSDGYVSTKSPIQVRVEIISLEVCWNDDPEVEYAENLSCFTEDGSWVFEFEADGTALAAKTKEIELDETLEVSGQAVTLNRLRFNPMELILFMEGAEARLKMEANLIDLASYFETDDGTRLRFWKNSFPYAGFRRTFMDPAVIQSLEETERLKIGFCVADPEKVEPHHSYFDLDYYICDPAWSTVVDIK